MTAPTLTPYTSSSFTTWTPFTAKSFAVGETLRIMVVVAGSTTTGVGTSSTGWKFFHACKAAAPSAAKMYIFYATDPAATEFTIVSDTSVSGGAGAYLIQLYGPNAFVCNMRANASTTACALTAGGLPPNISDAVWVALAGWPNSGGTAAAYPSGYSGTSTTAGGAVAKCSVCYKETSGVRVEDPGDFTLTTAIQSIAALLGCYTQDTGSFPDYFYQESGGFQTTVGNLDVEVLTNGICQTPESNTDYLLIASEEIALSSTTTSVETTLRMGGTELIASNVEFRTSNLYQSYTHGRIWNSGTVTGPIPMLQTLSSTGSAQGNSFRGRLLLLKIGASWTHAVDDTEQTNATTTPTDAITLTDTYAAGDYAVLVFGLANTNVNTSPVYVAIDVDGSASEETGALGGDITNWCPFMLMRKVTFDAGMHTTKLKYRAQAGATTKLKNITILVVPLADFSNSYYSARTTDAVGTNQFGGTALTVTETLEAADHLVLSFFPTSSSSTTNQLTVTVNDETEDLTQSVQRTFSSDLERSNNGSMMALRAYAAGSRTFTVSWTGSVSIATSHVENTSAILVLQLGSVEAPLDLVYRGEGPFPYVGARTPEEWYVGNRQLAA